MYARIAITAVNRTALQNKPLRRQKAVNVLATSSIVAADRRHQRRIPG